jgi:hypothetical protein
MHIEIETKYQKFVCSDYLTNSFEIHIIVINIFQKHYYV